MAFEASTASWHTKYCAFLFPCGTKCPGTGVDVKPPPFTKTFYQEWQPKSWPPNFKFVPKTDGKATVNGFTTRSCYVDKSKLPAAAKMCFGNPCGKGYTLKHGDVPGWGKIGGHGGGESVADCNGCAAFCDQQKDACKSYECSETEKKCNLNPQDEPVNTWSHGIGLIITPQKPHRFSHIFRTCHAHARSPCCVHGRSAFYHTQTCKTSDEKW